MDTLQISNTVSKIPKIFNFHGVFALDQIPIINSGSLIINLDPSFQEGSHWIAMSVHNGKASYFDSFAQNPPIEISKKFKIIEKMKNPVQPFFSKFCGYYAILFLFLKSRKYEMSTIEKIMKKVSDVKVKETVLALAI